jgi:hypothetical protein
MKPYLTEILDMALTLGLQDPTLSTCEFLRTILECCPKLRRLILRQDDFGCLVLHEALAYATPGRATFANLSSLLLEDIDMISKSGDTLSAHLDLQKLKDLGLLNCENFIVFWTVSVNSTLIKLARFREYACIS